MSIQLADRATVRGTHRTTDQYLAADARIARTGIQIYTGREVGKPELASVRVYRSADEVFSPATMASAAHKPMTLDHPAFNVDATRWKEAAVGWTGDAVTRDGETIRVPMMVADASAITGIETGKRELSCGYTCDLAWTPGVTPSGEAYDASQVGIRINHVAIVAAGRAGAMCRIGDSAAAASFLRDAVGAPLALIDRDLRTPIRVSDSLIAAIEAKAAQSGMPIERYLSDVLRYERAA